MLFGRNPRDLVFLRLQELYPVMQAVKFFLLALVQSGHRLQRLEFRLDVQKLGLGLADGRQSRIESLLCLVQQFPFPVQLVELAGNVAY